MKNNITKQKQKLTNTEISAGIVIISTGIICIVFDIFDIFLKHSSSFPIKSICTIGIIVATCIIITEYIQKNRNKESTIKKRISTLSKIEANTGTEIGLYAHKGQPCPPEIIEIQLAARAERFQWEQSLIQRGIPL